jgi:hypothetical protein
LILKQVGVDEIWGEDMLIGIAGSGFQHNRTLIVAAAIGAVMVAVSSATPRSRSSFNSR